LRATLGKPAHEGNGRVRGTTRNSILNDHRPDPASADADWIQTREALDAWLAGVDGLMAVDTEFMRRNTYHAQLALVQLAHDGRYALVDPLAAPIGDALADLDAEREPLWIMHSPSEDLGVLAPHLPAGPRRLFDTQLAAAFCGMGLGISYRALVEAVTGVQLDKGETRSDWLQRPLTGSQRLYAKLDVVHLDAIHTHLDRLLRERGRMAWFEHDCERLKARATGRNDDGQPQQALRGAAAWPRESQALLRRVLLWRDTTARAIDKPRPWLLQDAQAMSLVEDIPASGNELSARTQGQRALRGRQRNDLLEELRRPVDADEVAATASIPAALDGAGRRILAGMKQEVDRLARELDLPAGLLAPRKMLELYIATREWPDPLDGWRRELLHERLATHLPDA
jgi:ribonuclease D